MFDAIINSLGQQWGLGDKARPFVQMLLARLSDPQHGGFAGFVQRLRNGGMGNAVDAWMASPHTAVPVPAPDLERAIGDQNLVPDMASRFGIDRSKVLGALGYAIPAIVSLVSKGGMVPAGLPAEAETFIGNRGAWAAGAVPAAAQVAAVREPARNWLPWIAAGLIALLTLGYCSTQKRSEPVVTTPEPVAVAPAAPAPEPAPPVTPDIVVVEPEGAAVVAITVTGAPMLKVYFDSGKSEVSTEFKEKSVALVEHMNANTGLKAVISGFNDPTGDPAVNARLSKARAQAVQQKLVDAGIAEDRTVLEKPAETTGTATTNAGSRRVDVMLRE